MEKVSYLGFDNCYRITNQRFELIVSTDFGPRIVRYGKVGGPNVLGEFPGNQATTELGTWRPIAGHRLWAAPEAMPFSYAPDNEPVEARIEGNLAIRLIQSTDGAGLEKQMSVSLDTSTSSVEVSHRIINRRAAPLELAPWALTIFRGGTAIVPLEPFRAHGDAFLPSQPLVLWPFTDLGDPRILLGGQQFRVVCNTALESPQKLGVANLQGWAAYHHGSQLFVKFTSYIPGARYPDFGASTEVYVEGEYMEIESLAPLVELAPGAGTQHMERWKLIDGVSEDGLDEALQQIQ
jgi:hypothetical protein